MANCGLSLTTIKYERTILSRRREQVGIAFEARSLQHEVLGAVRADPARDSCCFLDSHQRVCGLGRQTGIENRSSPLQERNMSTSTAGRVTDRRSDGHGAS